MEHGGGGRKSRFFTQRGGESTKGYKSAIAEIAQDTFNTGQNKFAAQFTQSRKNVANCLQRTSASKGYLVAETVRTGKEQTIPLPPSVDPDAPDATDLKIIRDEEVKTIAKRRLKLQDALKQGYATVYDLCSQEVRYKLEATVDWEKTQREQYLHELMKKIERICVGFDAHKQEVFNLMQALKTLFLFTQGEKDSVDEYGKNFRSLWSTVEAFGRSPGVHRGLVQSVLNQPERVDDPSNITEKERREAKEKVAESVKAALLISRANKCRYWKLKDELANNYLLGTDQYPDTMDKALRILGNYQTTKVNTPFRAGGTESGLAFLQKGGQGGRGRGGGRGAGPAAAGRGEIKTGADAVAGVVSTMTGGSGGDGARTNSRGETHCYNCRAEDHWAYECPELTSEQQAQLHMNMKGNEDGEEGQQQEGRQLLNVTMAQGGALPDNRAYLDGCSRVTAFKTSKYLKRIKKVNVGIKINCNAGTVTTNQMGTYGSLKVWYVPEGIANIFSMHELEKWYCITYDSWEGHYIVYTPKGQVKFYKDEQGLPYVELDGTAGDQAAVMLLQSTHGETNAHVQTVRENYEGYTKR